MYIPTLQTIPLLPQNVIPAPIHQLSEEDRAKQVKFLSFL